MIHARHPTREFSPLSVGTYYGVSGVGEEGRTSELYLGSATNQHTLIHKLGTHASFGGIPKLRTQLRRNPTPAGKKFKSVDLAL